jgi:5-carboxymethyl-2-hydroxymuconate isomerase
MPHFVVEYSANLSEHVDMDEVLDLLHKSACEVAAFKPAALRIRAYPSMQYRIADLHKDNAFIHVRAHIASGRSEEVRRELGESMFEKLVAKLKPLFAHITLGISMEINEIHPVCSWRTGNLHENVAARAETKNS